MPAPEIRIVIIGPKGSGKSTLARRVRKALIDLGVWVEEIAPGDTYPGCFAMGEDRRILRRLWPHVSIRTEDALPVDPPHP